MASVDENCSGNNFSYKHDYIGDGDCIKMQESHHRSSYFIWTISNTYLMVRFLGWIVKLAYRKNISVRFPPISHHIAIMKDPLWWYNTTEPTSDTNKYGCIRTLWFLDNICQHIFALEHFLWAPLLSCRWYQSILQWPRIPIQGVG